MNSLQENGALPTALGFADRMEYPCRQRPSLPTATKGSRHSRLCRLPIDCGRQRSRFADSQPVGKEPQSANRVLGVTVTDAVGFADSPTVRLSAKAALCRQPGHAVGKIFIFFLNFELRLFV